MNTVTVLAHRRAGYLRQALEALARCDGVADWRVVLVLDRPDTETRHLVARNVRRWETVELDLANAGDDPYARVSRATLMALSLGFATSDFVAHLEEDCVPSADALVWMAAMATRYRDDPRVFTVNAWSGPETVPTLEPEHLDAWFTPWMFGTWIDRFTEMRASWDVAYWDRHLNERLRGNRLGVFPATSKVRDIGELNGVNPRSEWAARNGMVAQT